MANTGKKSFKETMSVEIGKGMDSIVRDSTKDKIPNVPKKTKRTTINDTGEVRATFIIDETLLELVKRIAHWDRILIKDVLNAALTVEVAKYKQQHGEPKPIPTKK